MTRNLLAVSWDMPPMSGPRAVQVSRTLKHLVPLGWDSWVICFRPGSNRYNQDPDLASRLQASRGVTLVPTASLEEHLMCRIAWRLAPPLKLLPDEKWVWIRAATRAALRLTTERQFDRLVSFAQPWSDHLVGLRLHRATGLPWIAHFSDPWIDSPYLQGRRWQRRLWARMEATVVRQANALVFVNTQTADRVMQKYPVEWRRKVHVVPHGFDCADVSIARARGTDPRLQLVYTGRFYAGLRTAEAFLRALSMLASRRPLARELHVSFVGTPLEEHHRIAKELRLGDIVEFVGRVPFAESSARAQLADVLLVVDAPATENLFLPSKLVEYLPADKPILALTPSKGATADLVRALGYPLVAPDDEAGIASAVESLIADKQQGRLTVSPDHSRVAQRYDIRTVAQTFADILEQCA
jgi:glycosyltransferase involved in cell wall biosynthesis